MNENFKFYIRVNYGMHHVTVETTHQDFAKYVDDMAKEFDIYKERAGNKLTVWIENYYGDRDEIGYVWQGYKK